MDKALQSESHAERIAALDRLRAEVEDERVKAQLALQKEIGATNSRAAERIAAAEKAAEDRRLALAEGLAAELGRQLAPLVRAFREDPSRPTVRPLAQCWARFAALAVEQLGAELNDRLLAVAFADAIAVDRPHAVLAFASPDFGAGQRVIDALGAWRRASDLAGQEAAALAVEGALTGAAARGDGLAQTTSEGQAERQAKRYARRRSCATLADEYRFWSEVAAEQRAIDVASVPPPSPSEPPRRPSPAHDLLGREDDQRFEPLRS